MIGRLNHTPSPCPTSQGGHLYRTVMGAKVSEPKAQPAHGVTVVFVELPNTKIELLHPLGEKSPIANFLARNADGGIHHVCYEVEDIYAARDKLKSQGARVLGDGEPKIGAHDKPVLFLHPKDFTGTLIESSRCRTIASWELANHEGVRGGPMSWATGVMVFVVIWWTVIFAVLPLGVRRADDSRPAPTAAPQRPDLRARLTMTAITASCGCPFVVRVLDVFALRDGAEQATKQTVIPEDLPFVRAMAVSPRTVLCRLPVFGRFSSSNWQWAWPQLPDARFLAEPTGVPSIFLARDTYF
jgi:methylmalonyl-CoA/ethylmalonyl-CoA epimerase